MFIKQVERQKMEKALNILFLVETRGLLLLPPRFVDNEDPWSPELVKVFGWVIFSLILVCLIVMFLITYATFKGPLRGHFLNGEVKTQSDNAPPPPKELPEFTGLQQEFLLDHDVTHSAVDALTHQRNR